MSVAFRGNIGDGIRMAQAVGADLRHMWHYHGTYGFRVDGYPLGVRTKRLPDWFPGVESVDDGPAEAVIAGIPPGNRAVTMPWILVDRDGRRFMNEYEPYLQDTGHRPFERYRMETQEFPRIPCWMIADEAGRERFPWGQPIFNDPELALGWSKDNAEEIGKGTLRRADTLAALAAMMALDPAVLEATVGGWNAACGTGDDAVHLRPASSMMPIARAPFYCAEIWPMVSNTQGGPVHDAGRRVLDPFGEPVPRLFAAGELGSVFGHLYLSGGNVTECFVGGQIAGTGAATGGPPP